MKEFIDATIFMGMHHENDNVRISCKNFFVTRYKKTIYISLENVGRCDDVVWKFSRKQQDAYFPFMDELYTLMDIRRVPYQKKDIEKMKINYGLPLLETLTLSQSSGGNLFTINKKILNKNLKNIFLPEKAETEFKFPASLEKLYRESLILRLKSS